MSDKPTTLKLLDEGYQNFRKAIDGLDAAALERVWYGTWSVKDIIAHLLGWEKEMGGALERMARGEKPVPEGVDYADSDAWNAKFSLAMKQQLPSTVLAEWGRLHQLYRKAAAAVPDDRFGEGKTANRLVETSGYGHYREHAAPIREWRQREKL
jgi:hypothetical protein